MIIRPVTTENYASMIDLYQELERYYSGEAGVHSPDLIETYIRDKMLGDSSGVKLVGAFEADQLLGFAAYSLLFPAPNLKGQLYMKELFVGEAARGKSVGRQLIAHLAQIALDNDCECLDWTAETTNPNAIRFYEHIGAELVSEKRYFRLSGN